MMADQQKLYDHPGNKKSIVWKYFGFVKTQDGPANKTTLDMSKAICILCRKAYADKVLLGCLCIKNTFFKDLKLTIDPIIIDNRIGKVTPIIPINRLLIFIRFPTLVETNSKFVIGKKDC